MTLSIAKDRAFAQLFGKGSAPAKVPLVTYALFTTRDLATVACSFNLPPVVADWVSRNKDANLPDIVKDNPRTTAQLVVPTALQFFSTPIHVLALDFYNRQNTPTTPSYEKITLQLRAQFVAREYPASTLARMARILPAFGIGGIANMKLREGGARWLNRKFAGEE